jgi:hypothetical protein
MPLVSGVNIAGLVLMGRFANGAVSGQNTPTDLDARIRRYVTHSRGALLILPEQLKIDFGIKELDPACQQPVN